MPLAALYSGKDEPPSHQLPGFLGKPTSEARHAEQCHTAEEDAATGIVCAGGEEPVRPRVRTGSRRGVQPFSTTIRVLPSWSRKLNIGGTGAPQRWTSGSVSTPRERSVAWSASMSSEVRMSPVS